MTITTLPYPTTPAAWNELVALQRQPSGRTCLVSGHVWFAALRTAYAGGWAFQGATPSVLRTGYAPARGQRLSAKDARGIADGLQRGLDRHALLSAHERAGAVVPAVPMPGQTMPMFVLASVGNERIEKVGRGVLAFHALEPHLSGVEHKAEPVVKALRALADWLRASDDVVLSDAPPVGWYPPGTPMARVRVVTDRPIQLAGRAVTRGEVLDVPASEADMIVLGGSAERLDDAGEVVPIPRTPRHPMAANLLDQAAERHSQPGGF